MYEYISGKLADKGRDYCVVEAAGIGYRIFTSFSSLFEAGDAGSDIKMYTYLHVREDIFCLYGFVSREELSMFEFLLQVSGIGPKAALSVLSSTTPQKFALSIVTGDIKAITKIPGIGQKTAQRMVLELKDKFKNETFDKTIEQGNLLAEGLSSINGAGGDDDSLLALMSMGFGRFESYEAIKRVKVEGQSIEDTIRLALKTMVRK